MIFHGNAVNFAANQSYRHRGATGGTPESVAVHICGIKTLAV